MGMANYRIEFLIGIFRFVILKIKYLNPLKLKVNVNDI